MQQLSLIDFYDSVCEKAERAIHRAQKVKICTQAKIKTILEKQREKKKRLEEADFVVSINKKGNFVLRGDVGNVKIHILSIAGIYMPYLEDYDVYEFVLGKYNSKKHDDSIIKYEFTEEAERKINKLRKELRRRNIPLKVDVDATDLEVLGV